ncbi:hypothetical protein MGMO_224c00080 [Methyloglobulus morosus KoM1]|uniref:Uncharacterized protein n=1 Tax=Methyloglobulus morosus KoM1 TaxID=1116472 RepID=V5DEQ5_9GAMM|nr:hypothetical protein MGMO_224c00080 [Methyloglobulus morosus KoM1]
MRNCHQALNIQLRLSTQLLLSTMTLIDDKKITVEHRFYSFKVKDRLIMDIDPLSVVGQLYIKGFESLFDKSRTVNGIEAYDEVISQWKKLLEHN